MRFSYSRIQTWKQCPYKYKLRYIDKLKTIPDQSASNALYLGIGLHKGIETTPAEGVEEYKSNFYIVTNEIINWGIQIEYWAEKVKELLPPGGQHEATLMTDDYIGFIDYVTDDTILDFKFTTPKNYPRYLESPQLKIYAHYWKKLHPESNIKHLKYVFIPKSAVRQRRNETIQQFRQRLIETLDTMKIEIVEVPYNGCDDDSVTQFVEDCKRIEIARDFPKNETPLCQWCDYCNYCLNGEDYDIV